MLEDETGLGWAPDPEEKPQSSVTTIPALW